MPTGVAEKREEWKNRQGFVFVETPFMASSREIEKRDEYRKKEPYPKCTATKDTKTNHITSHHITTRRDE